MSTSATLSELLPFEPESFSYETRQWTSSQQGAFHSALPQPQRASDQTRPYIPGDSLSYVDWRAFARTETLLVRQEIPLARVSVLIQLDARDSMHWPEKERSSKFQVGCRIAFDLASLHLRMGQTVCLQLYRELDQPSILLLREWAQVIDFFDSVQPKFSLESMEPFFSPLGLASFSPSLSYGISDLFADWVPLHDHVKQAFMIHLLHEKEMDLSWLRPDTLYFDEKENREQVGHHLIFHSQTKIHRWLEEEKQKWESNGFQYGLFTNASLISAYREWVRGHQ